MPEVRIRKAKTNDAKYMVALAHQMDYEITPAEARNRLRAIIRQKEDIMLVATFGRKVIGFVHGISIIEILTPKTLRLGGLVVSTENCLGGIGKSLMAKLEEWAKKKKFSIVLVPSNVTRKGAHEFYKAIGYKNIKSQYIFEKEI